MLSFINQQVLGSIKNGLMQVFKAANMDWREIYEDDLNQESCWGYQPVPKWFLLKPPQIKAVA